MIWTYLEGATPWSISIMDGIAVQELRKNQPVISFFSGNVQDRDPDPKGSLASPVSVHSNTEE